jgi:hypothetical protein
MASTMFLKKSQSWIPHKDFKATSDEIDGVLEYADQWSKNKFHKYFKTIESHLLTNFRNTINQCYKRCKLLETEWISTTQMQWRILALFRDFHDYMCGRDHKHYIRTDDCRRFVLGITKGLKSKKFIKPVRRLLSGENAPRNFTHPLFVEFN